MVEAAEAGHAAAAASVAPRLAARGDLASAARCFALAADAGDAESANEIGVLLLQGDEAETGVRRDAVVARLAEDHALARNIGERIADLPCINYVLPVETNIVIFELADGAPTAAEVVERLLASGVRVGAFGPRTIRAVTHLDVDAASGDSLVQALAEVAAG